jgi:hypothetical protein
MGWFDGWEEFLAFFWELLMKDITIWEDITIKVWHAIAIFIFILVVIGIFRMRRGSR